MTMRQAAQTALDVQSACNLSGVVRSFAEIVSWMRMDLKLDTPTCNQHPVCRLFAEQIAYLTAGVSVDDSDGEYTYNKAYDWCVSAAKPVEEATP